MKTKSMEFSLLIVLLATLFASLPVIAGCDQEELCEAQLVVTDLLDEIVEQRDVIKAHWKMLDTAQDRPPIAKWYEWSLRLVDVVSRYLHIGTLESQLLLAHHKLGLIKMEMGPHDTVCHCSEKIQLSAR